MIAINEKISELRKAKNMTQEEMANTIGVSAQSVSKWENAVTMPDILLLPVIADIFGVSIDELFGKSSKNEVKQIAYDDIFDEACNSMLSTMQKAWWNNKEAFLPFDETVYRYKKHLKENPNSQTAIIRKKNGIIYYNEQSGGLILKKPESGWLQLFEDKNIYDFLETIGNSNFYHLFAYMLRNPDLQFTKSSISKSCNIKETDAENVIEQMLKYQIISRKEADTGDEKIYIYGLYNTHRYILIFAILTYIKRFTEYQENYYGFWGDGNFFHNL
ncbi:MAG: helix-turn-helix transcriptional regulator [Eubacteriales bacterium]|nr:helix-turn-helix transcriptional regulator [Eubacteriales bacterium]